MSTSFESRAVHGGYRFAFEFHGAAGRRLGSVPAEPDFEPVEQWVRFLAMRRGQIPPLQGAGSLHVSPLWDEDLGAPVCRALHASFERSDASAPIETEIPVDSFAELAGSKASVLVERGDLAEGESYQYRLCAHPIIATPALDEVAGMRVESVVHPLPLVDTPLSSFSQRASERAPHDDLDPLLFSASWVIDETLGLAAEARGLETGGVLVGRLHRDTEVPDIFVEITAQIPARHAEASESSFAFTPETWAAAHAALELRGNGELIVGWWHSHPKFCRLCPEARWRHCVYARPFFSADDVHLHRTCFPLAYQVALLISDLPEEGPTPEVYGWRAGRVVARGYHVVEPTSH